VKLFEIKMKKLVSSFRIVNCCSTGRLIPNIS
jgi:hypothetical protein